MNIIKIENQKNDFYIHEMFSVNTVIVIKIVGKESQTSWGKS